MSSIQTLWQVPTGETTGGGNRDGEQMDVCGVLDTPIGQEKLIAKPKLKGKRLRLAVIESIRVSLRGVPDGMTLSDLSALLDRPESNVRKVLKAMPDTYIDRWEKAPRGQYKAVWCVVTPPPDCPRPEGTSDEQR
jgi:hypothetical protein